MRFFCGTCHPAKAHLFERAFLSITSLVDRRSDFAVRSWVLDSGAFFFMQRYGEHQLSVCDYAAHIRRWSRCGRLEAAVAQDYLCGFSRPVGACQRLSIERYDQLAAQDLGGVHLMPVLHGETPADYARHALDYGTRLGPGGWVGVGSLVPHSRNPAWIQAVLDSVLSVRPDLKLHGFGLKLRCLKDGAVRTRLESADSMAWSYAARKQKGRGNDYRDALAFVAEIEGAAVQLPLF